MSGQLNIHRHIGINDREAAYVRLRKSGMTEGQAQDDLGLTASMMRRYELAFRSEAYVGMAYAGDATVPKFADHDKHLAALAPFVGFDKVANFMLRRPA